MQLDREVRRARAQKPPEYEAQEDGIYVKGHARWTRLSNFTVRIVGEALINGQRHFHLTATLHGKALRFSIPARDFDNMTWVIEYLGPQAVVFPGQREHLRAAIQLLTMEDTS